MEGARTHWDIEKVRTFYRVQGGALSTERLYKSIPAHTLHTARVMHNAQPPRAHQEVFEYKKERARRFASFFTLIPYSRMVFLSGSLACGTPHAESDIDVVVVAAHNRVWLNRLLVQGVFWCVGARRTRHQHKDRLCINYSLSDREPVIRTQGFVAAHFYKHLMPLWSARGAHIKQFWRANSWIRSHAPHFPLADKPITPSNRFSLAHYLRSAVEWVCDTSGIGALGEWGARRFQQYYINRAKQRTPSTTSSVVLCTNNHIYYHFPHSHWIKRQQTFEKALGDISVENM